MNRFGLAFIALVAAACEQTDFNSPCLLVRGTGDGGTAYLSKSDPIIKNSANKDFISFGSAGCEDRVCVRDSSFTEVDDGGFAEGYCSSNCTPGSTVGCASYTGGLDKDPKTRLSCRALVLDEATLAAIKAADPVSYQRIFGMTTSPYFCARSQTLSDGGSI